tara:strand:- start:66960 stop:67790 length:831 start_codon:yes stop_codon:yes gene_type:complete
MVIRFLCKCGKSLKAPDEYIGKKVACSKCNNIMKVPEQDQVITAEKKSKRPAAAFHDQQVSLPPLSEIRSKEEILAEKSSAPNPEESASSNLAKQLLRQSSSLETDKPDASHPKRELPPKKSGIKNWLDENKSFKEYCKYNAKLILPGAAGVIVLCFGLYYLMSAMVKTVDHPPLEMVSGIVTLDDKPLPHAEVIFIPQEDWKEDQKPAQSVGVTDEQGKFVLSYSKDLKGAALGKHAVRIFSSETIIPIIYNVKTVLTYEVKNSDNNPDFKLVSR